MTRLVATLILAALPLAAALAQQPAQKPRKAERAGALQPARSKACPEYGPGFIKLPGSNTCIKIGGAVSIESGINVGH